MNAKKELHRFEKFCDKAALDAGIPETELKNVRPRLRFRTSSWGARGLVLLEGGTVKLKTLGPKLRRGRSVTGPRKHVQVVYDHVLGYGGGRRAAVDAAIAHMKAAAKRRAAPAGAA